MYSAPGLVAFLLSVWNQSSLIDWLAISNGTRATLTPPSFVLPLVTVCGFSWWLILARAARCGIESRSALLWRVVDWFEVPILSTAAAAAVVGEVAFAAHAVAPLSARIAWPLCALLFAFGWQALGSRIATSIADHAVARTVWLTLAFLALYAIALDRAAELSVARWFIDREPYLLAVLFGQLLVVWAVIGFQSRRKPSRQAAPMYEVNSWL